MGDSEILQKILAEISGVKSEMSQLRRDFDQLRTEVTKLRGEVTELRSDMTELQTKVSTLQQQMDDGFARVHEELREIRAIQDAHGKELNALHEGVSAIGRKLARVGEILG